MNKKTNKTPSPSQRAAAKKQARPHSAKPLERVEMDHMPLDVVVMDDNGNASRPTLTVALDSATRIPIGFHLGMPQEIVVDNGREFHAEALAAVTSFLGQELHIEASNEPHFKGHIERLFQEFSQRNR